MYGGLDSSLWSGKQDRLTGSAWPWIERIGSTEPGKLVITKLIIVIELGHFGETRGCHFGSKFANSPIILKRTNGPGWTNYYLIQGEKQPTLRSLCHTFELFHDSLERRRVPNIQPLVVMWMCGMFIWATRTSIVRQFRCCKRGTCKKWNEGNFDQQSNINLLKSLEASCD